MNRFKELLSCVAFSYGLSLKQTMRLGTASLITIFLLVTTGAAAQDAEVQELKSRVEELEKKLEEKEEAPVSELPEWLKSIELHSFLSVGYVYNFNEPDSDINSQRLFDFRHNAFRVDDFQFSLLRAIQDPGDVGFRFDLDVGSNIPRVIHSTGLLTGEDIDLRQAFISYNAPLGNGLTVVLGKFITHFGLEVIEGWPGFNDNYSRSYDFSFAIPFTHTGLRATYPISEQLSVMAMVVNGWDQVDDINDQKGYGGQIGVFPMEGVSLYFNYLGSPEQPDRDGAWRHLFGFTWVAKPLPGVLPDLTFSGTYDYGFEEDLVVNPVTGNTEDVEWHAAQAVVRYDFTPWFYVALRGEWMDDEDGVRIAPCPSGDLCAGADVRTFGLGQRVWAITVTPTFKIGEHLVVRPEFRYDESTENVFEDEGGGLEDNQTTVGVNAIYYF